MSTVFISHSSTDKELARRLAEDLKGLGHSPWLDAWEIKVGQCITTRVGDGLENAEFVLLLMTPAAIDSGWVDREWKAKYHEEIERRDVMILPVMVQSCVVPMLLRGRRYADFRTNYAVGLAELAVALVPTPVSESTQPGPQPVPEVFKAARSVENLLREVQSKADHLSASIAECLVQARQAGNADLEKFCRSELAGYHGTLDKRDPLFPRHRVVKAYCSPWARINSGFFDTQEAAFSFLANSGNFAPYTGLWPDPIAELEARAVPTSESRKLLSGWETPISQVIPDWQSMNLPADHPVVFYARGDTPARIVEATRGELTRRLLDLLPTAPSPRG